MPDCSPRDRRVYRVGAVKVEGLRLREVVPEAFECESGVEVSFEAQKGNHLPDENKSRRVAFGGGTDRGEEVFCEGVEQRGVESAVDHEGRQRLNGVRHEVFA
jgi:hypothetical protein